MHIRHTGVRSWFAPVIRENLIEMSGLSHSMLPMRFQVCLSLNNRVFGARSQLQEHSFQPVFLFQAQPRTSASGCREPFWIMHCMGVRCLKLNGISGFGYSTAHRDSDTSSASNLAYFLQAPRQSRRHGARERKRVKERKMRVSLVTCCYEISF